jgi:hypothetical protein
MKNNPFQSDLVKHFNNILDDETVDYIKSLVVNEKLKWEYLYLAIVEKYPQFRVNIVGGKYTRSKRSESKALYVAAINYYQNRTPSHAWERW